MVIGRAPVPSRTVKTGQVSFAAGGYTHIVRNVGPTPLHFIDVELLTERTSRGAGISADGSRCRWPAMCWS